MPALQFPRETIPAFVMVVGGGVAMGLVQWASIKTFFGDQKRYHLHNHEWQYYVNDVQHALHTLNRERIAAEAKAAAAGAEDETSTTSETQ